MQGIVLDIDLKTDSGVIRGDDQLRYEFDLADCRKGNPLDGATVDFEVQDGKAVAIYVLSSPLKAKIDSLFWFLFSFRGRISRDQFLMFITASLLVLPLPAVCAVWSGLPAFWEIGGLLFSFSFLSVLVKRFHDSGTSAAWLFFTLVFVLFVMSVSFRVLNLAFIGTTALYVLIALSALLIVFCLYLCFAKGSIGSNRYGKEPCSCKTVRLK